MLEWSQKPIPHLNGRQVGLYQCQGKKHQFCSSHQQAPHGQLVPGKGSRTTHADAGKQRFHYVNGHSHSPPHPFHIAISLYV